MSEEIRPADIRLYYCKSKKKTGNPIMVRELDGKEYSTNYIEYENVTARMQFNNAISKEKSSGATTILELWKRTMLSDNDTLRFNTVRTSTRGYTKSCDGCSKDFKVGDTRYQWRLDSPQHAYYHHGSFWRNHCEDCVREHCKKWIDSLYKLIDNINSQRHD